MALGNYILEIVLSPRARIEDSTETLKYSRNESYINALGSLFLVQVLFFDYFLTNSK